MNRFLCRVHKGFTLVEIMIVVLIIGILLAIAVPNFMKARENTRAKSCLANLRSISYAKEQWAVEFNKHTADEPVEAALYGSSGYIRTTPLCPTGGDYTINDLANVPVCSIGNQGNADATDDHVLP